MSSYYSHLTLPDDLPWRIDAPDDDVLAMDVTGVWVDGDLLDLAFSFDIHRGLASYLIPNIVNQDGTLHIVPVEGDITVEFTLGGKRYYLEDPEAAYCRRNPHVIHTVDAQGRTKITHDDDRMHCLLMRKAVRR